MSIEFDDGADVSRTGAPPALSSALGAGLAADLFISEIIEGSGLNKAVEIFNGTGASIDLSAYSVQVYFNGSSSAGVSIALSGTLADGDVFVLADDGADSAILAVADLVTTQSLFNGDDGIVLAKGGAIIDAFGQLGFDPGAEWPGGGQDETLIRRASVVAGDADFTDAFDASVEWESRPINDVSDLGVHSFDGGDPEPLKLSLGASAIDENGSTTGTVTRQGSSGDLVVTLSSSDAGAATVPASVVIADGETSAEFTVAGVDEDQVDPDVQITITAAAGVDLAEASLVVRNDDVPFVMIHDIQGAGGAADGAELGVDDRSPLEGTVVTIEAVVVGDYQNGFGADGDLDGFFLQEEDADADGDPLTSEGIFVFEGSSPAIDVAVGDTVRVTGTVSEFFGKTQISAGSVEVLSSGAALPTAASVVFPVAGVQTYGSGAFTANLEAYEGMRVTIPQGMLVTELFNLDRFGEYRIASSRFEQFSQSNAPDAAGYLAHLQALARATVGIDDGLGIQNPFPVKVIDGNDGLLTKTDAFGMGDTLTNVTGVVDYSFNTFEILAPTGDYENTVARHEAPTETGGNFKVASLNVLNFFSTLDDGTHDVVGPDLDQEPRGADSVAEFERQIAKTVQALVAMNADVVGLVEIENDFLGAGGIAPGPGAPSQRNPPIQVLVDALNAELGAGAYDWVDPGTEFVGGDAIATAFIYRTGTVATVGDAAILTEFDGRDFLDPLGSGNDLNRAALAQTFLDKASGQTLTISVNHFKSKGSASGVPGDDSPETGAGNANLTRVAAAEILSDWLASDPTGQGAARKLILGDLNSYASEQPIKTLEARGYANLAALSDPDVYSYVFDGQIGTLDYILADATALKDFVAATAWRINADEADIFDYDLDFGRNPDFYDGGTAARNSDHDPIIVSFDFYNRIAGRPGHDTLRGTDLRDEIDGGDGRDMIQGRGGDDLILGGARKDKLLGQKGDDTIYDGAGADRSIGHAGDDAFVWGGGNVDVVITGKGADTVVVDPEVANDGIVDRLRISDFDSKHDQLDLSGVGIAEVSDRRGLLRIVLEGDGDVILLPGIKDFDDIHFVDDPLTIV